MKKGICKPTKFKLRFDGHPIIAYVLLCEDQVECTACGISQMNQTRIETSNQKATMRSEREDLWEKLNICDIKQILSHIIWTRKKR